MTQSSGNNNPTLFFKNNPKLTVTDEQFYKFILQPELSQILYERYIIAKLPSLPEKKQALLKEQLGHIALFEIHTTCFPGFLRYIRKLVRKKPWYMKHIKELGYLIAIDLLYGDYATLRKAKEKPKEDMSKSTLVYERLSTRTRQRMFQYYPELLSKPLREVMTELKKTEQAFKTSYTAPPIGEMDPYYLASMPIQLDQYDIGFLKIRQLLAPIHADYRMAEPYDTEELLIFHDYMKESVKGFILQFGEPPQCNQWIKNHLLEGTTLTEHLYQGNMLAVIGRWFRKKAPSARLRLLKEKHPLRYTRKDARDAVKFTSQWINEQAALYDTLQRGVNGFNQYKMFQQGTWIQEECLKQLDLNPIDKGLCLNNLAEQYNLIGKHRKNKIYLLKALEVFEDINSDYDVAITLGYLCRANYLLGEAEKMAECKEKAITLLHGLQDSDFRLSWAYIRHADVAQMTDDLKWELDSLSRGLDHAARMVDGTLFDYINQRLITFNQGKNTMEIERRGFLKRPKITHWEKIGSSYHPRLPSDETPPV